MSNRHNLQDPYLLSLVKKFIIQMQRRRFVTNGKLLINKKVETNSSKGSINSGSF